jgi:hypothetical protein
MMAFIDRHANAPWLNRERCFAEDLETDLGGVINAVNNGTLDSTNFSNTANIDGSKLASTTLTQLRTGQLAVGVAEAAFSAVGDVEFSVATPTSNTELDSTSFATVPSVSTVTVKPGSASNRLLMGFFASITQTDVSGSGSRSYEFRFNDSADTTIETDTLVTHRFNTGSGTGSMAGAAIYNVAFSHIAMATSPSASAFTLDIEYKAGAGSANCHLAANFPVILFCKVIPVK